MKIKYYSFITALFLLASTSFAQTPRGAEQRPAPAAVPQVNTNSDVHGNNTVLQSHIKSLGSIGKTRRYEIVQIKIRGLDTPNMAGFLVYDSATDSIVGGSQGTAPGLGVAIVNGGAQVAGNYLFGSKLRPSQENTSVNGGEVTATGGAGGDSKAAADATGGAGGAGGNGGVSTSNATGGTSSATGGTAVSASTSGSTANSTSTSTSTTSSTSTGGQKVPPGHINNPSGNNHGHNNKK